MTNCSENTKRHNERQEQRKRQSRHLLILALMLGFVAGFFIGRISVQAVAAEARLKSDEMVADVFSVASMIPPKEDNVIRDFESEPEPEVKWEPDPESTITPEPEPEPEWVTYRITAYCSCEICCGEWAKNRPNGIVYGAAGVPLQVGVSCASPLPFGTVVEIEGLGTYVVQDRMAQWVIDKYGEALLDIYFEDHQAASAFGMQFLNVHVKGVPENDSV